MPFKKGQEPLTKKAFFKSLCLRPFLKLSFVFSNIGLIPDGGAHWSLSQKLGYNKALEFIINGEHVSATECEKLGLANKVFAEENFTEEVDSWAHSLAKRSPLVAKGTKELLRFSKHNDYWSTFKKEIKMKSIFIS